MWLEIVANLGRTKMKMNMFLGITLKAEMKAEQNCRDRNGVDAERKPRCTQSGGMRVGEGTGAAGTVPIANPEVLPVFLQGMDVQLVGYHPTKEQRQRPRV